MSRWRSMLRPGNAGSNTAADHITVVRDALRQLPGTGRDPARAQGAGPRRRGRRHPRVPRLAGPPAAVVLGRVHPARRPRRQASSPRSRASAWQPAYDADGKVRAGAWVAEVTGLLNLSGWPKGMRVIVRKERPHPGAQLRLTDLDGHRVTAFATNTAPAAANSPTSNCATAAAPAPKTGSAARRTPGSPTCRCTSSPRTRSGAPSSPWPASSPPGCRLLAFTDATPARPVGTQTPTAAAVLTARRDRPHRPPHPAPPARHAAWAASLTDATSPAPPLAVPADRTPRPVPTTRNPPGPWNRRPPRRHSGKLSYPTGKNQPSHDRQRPGRSSEHTRRRKIRASTTAGVNTRREVRTISQ